MNNLLTAIRGTIKSQLHAPKWGFVFVTSMYWITEILAISFCFGVLQTAVGVQTTGYVVGVEFGTYLIWKVFTYLFQGLIGLVEIKSLTTNSLLMLAFVWVIASMSCSAFLVLLCLISNIAIPTIGELWSMSSFLSLGFVGWILIMKRNRELLKQVQLNDLS